MKSKIGMTLIAYLLLCGCQQEPARTADLFGKKVLMIIASKNFRDEEYREPWTILHLSGAQLTTACSSLGEARGMLGMTVKPDILLKDAKVADYDAVIFVGGMGASEYFDDPVAHKLAREAAAAGKVVAAICIAPVTLAKAGILKGKRVTAFPSVKADIEKGGAQYTGAPLEADGNIITGKGPDVARKFANAIVEALSKK